MAKHTIQISLKLCFLDCITCFIDYNNFCQPKRSRDVEKRMEILQRLRSQINESAHKQIVSMINQCKLKSM